jgi:hypothetical protein
MDVTNLPIFKQDSNLEQNIYNNLLNALKQELEPKNVVKTDEMVSLKRFH